jgi:hypothetical protein
MTTFHRSAGSVLIAAVFMSGCYGSGASTYEGVPTGSGGNTTVASGGTTTASGGTTTSAGGTTASAGGTTSSASGGTTAGSGGISTNSGGILTSAGGTAAGSGGTSTGSGGNTTGTGGNTTRSGGNTSTSAGGNATAGGNTTGGGGTTASSGGTTARTGGTTPAGGTTAAGGTTSGTGGAAAGGSTGTTTGWATPVAGGPTGTGTTATVTVNPSSTVGTIGDDFAGFSYEKSHITNGSFTSNNASMIALYKLLGSPMMRLAANDVDVCSWGGTGTAPSQPSGQPFTHTILTGHVDQLCGFLAATGTKIIYGVNFKLGNVPASAAEAAYVMGKCPSSIHSFEIGNEIDKYGSWSAQTTQYESFATAILAAPGALLAGPGSTGGSYSSFSVPFAASETAKWGTKLTLLTQHYYVASSSSTSATAANLQTVASNFVSLCTTMNTAAKTNKTPNAYRVGETNTFSGHGQSGVSNTLISGLWAIDIMFTIAKNGGSGVNFHNGETGMDGTVPFYYSAIKETNGVVVEVEPEYYGMLLFTQAGTGSMVATTVTTTAQYFTAWAIKANGFTGVVLNNKNAASGVNATVDLGAAVSSASAIYLQGTPTGSLTVPATGVTLAGATITPAGVWSRNAPYVQTTSGNTVSVYIPPASAALVRGLP